MLYAQVVFSGLLVLFACLTWHVSKSIHDLHRQESEWRYNPELLAKGWWQSRLTLKEGVPTNTWRGELVLANPGPTPIYITMVETMDAAPGTTMTVEWPGYDYYKPTLGVPVIIPGYSHQAMEIEIQGTRADRFEITYDTAQIQGRKKIAQLLPAIDL